MQGSENVATLIGRILMSLLFVTSGWGKLTGAAAVQAMFAKQGLPMVEDRKSTRLNSSHRR